MSIIDWFNQNVGFFSALMAVFSFIVSVTTVIITIIVARKQNELQNHQNEIEGFAYKSRFIEILISLMCYLNQIEDNISLMFIHKKDTPNPYLKPLENYLNQISYYKAEIIIAKKFFKEDCDMIIDFETLFFKINPRLKDFYENIQNSCSDQEKKNLYENSMTIRDLIKKLDHEYKNIIEMIS